MKTSHTASAQTMAPRSSIRKLVGMMSGMFQGPTDGELDAAFPPQLCSSCARPLDAVLLTEDTLHVSLSCPVHGEVGVIPPPM